MSYVVEQHCGMCDTNSLFVNGICSTCKKASDELAEEKWQALSLEKKLQELRKRISFLEHLHQIKN